MAIVAGGTSCAVLAFLKVMFPLDPPEVALRLLWFAITSGIISLICSIIALPGWRAYISLLLTFGALVLFLFAWPFYALP